ncbi:MAG: P1 family peptidase [Acidimicrobiia bacterium]|jgi:L-aminopeptidase/D-esterase-like protein
MSEPAESEGTLTSVPGVAVGHWTDPLALTGCTVVVLPEPNQAAIDVRGAAPATRETDLLRPGMLVEQVQAILLTGGSAFGLAAADGVVTGLEQAGRGFPTPAGPVPIVPAAAIYDLGVGDPSVRPGPDEGRMALAAAHRDPVAQGRVGAGTGASLGGWRGAGHVQSGGLGSFAVTVDGATVAALAVVNAVGDAFTLEGEPLTGGSPVPERPGGGPGFGTSTTLVVIATDAALTRTQLNPVMVRAHDGLAACLRPVHTRYDGDVVFGISCGEIRADLDAVAEAAFVATGRSVEAAVRLGGLEPGLPLRR